MTMAFKVKLFLLDLVAIILVVCSQVDCVLPQHLPNVMNDNLGRSKILRVGSQLQRRLLFILMHHGIRLSLRHSKRSVKTLA